MMDGSAAYAPHGRGQSDDKEDGVHVVRLTVRNFRGIADGTVHLSEHSLLVGGNSIGKSTICEALELVLGPERLYARPVVDEFDFHNKRYQPSDSGDLPLINIEAVLLGLSTEAERRFHSHLRRWSPGTHDFADVEEAAVEDETAPWCLPVRFVGRFDPTEDDFIGGTYFSHPEQPVVGTPELRPGEALPGGTLVPFQRDDKRLCGFLYLRANRTGRRALSFERGSLLDTIIRLQSDPNDPVWETILVDLEATDSVRADTALGKVRVDLEDRVARFVALADVDNPVDIHTSELTRDHLRQMLRLFVTTTPGTYGLPFTRLSTGTLNLLVFALLTYIAERKGDVSVIFAMEEPEIALPPHAQRLLVDFVLERMGQVIVTSHSPYVIQRFAPQELVVLRRGDDGSLSGAPVDMKDVKAKRYGDNRWQFSEAVLARAVFVVEGATEATLFPLASEILHRDDPQHYVPFDYQGISIFDAQNDVSVPDFAPVFSDMGKVTFGWHDTPTTPFTSARQERAKRFNLYESITEKSIEELLANETPLPVLERFLSKVATRGDYPAGLAKIGGSETEPEVRALAKDVLTANKGAKGYTVLLMEECSSAGDLPPTIVSFLYRAHAAVLSSMPRKQRGAGSPATGSTGATLEDGVSSTSPSASHAVAATEGVSPENAT